MQVLKNQRDKGNLQEADWTAQWVEVVGDRDCHVLAVACSKPTAQPCGHPSDGTGGFVEWRPPWCQDEQPGSDYSGLFEQLGAS